MPLLGHAAMLLSFDVADEALREHDDWHTHEHLPERLAIPGFLRGTRWVALRGTPRYLVLYEVAELATLTSAAYLRRLERPSAWTSSIMLHYRGMRRGFCVVAGSFGGGVGHLVRAIRFRPPPAPAEAASLRAWLLQDVLPPLPSIPGLGSAHLLEGAVTPPMTEEQRLRGADAPVDWAILVGAYREEAVDEAATAPLDRGSLQRRGATDVDDAIYRLDYALSREELS